MNEASVPSAKDLRLNIARKVERFSLFVAILCEYLEERDPILLKKVEHIIKYESNFLWLSAMTKKLKEVVDDKYWQPCNFLLTNSFEIDPLPEMLSKEAVSIAKAAKALVARSNAKAAARRAANSKRRVDDDDGDDDDDDDDDNDNNTATASWKDMYIKALEENAKLWNENENDVWKDKYIKLQQENEKLLRRLQKQQGQQKNGENNNHNMVSSINNDDYDSKKKKESATKRRRIGLMRFSCCGIKGP